MFQRSCIFLAFTVLLFLFHGCASMPSISKNPVFNFPETENTLFTEFQAELSSDIQKGISSIKIDIVKQGNFKKILPVLTIKTNSSFNPGGSIAFKIPVSDKITSDIYSGEIRDLTFCIFNFSLGRWEKVNTLFDPSTKELKGEIESIKKDNLDSSLSKILVAVSLPAKEGLITNLYQENKLISGDKGSIDSFFNSKDKKNCMIIHGVTSNPENMMELYKTVKALNYYDNIIFYQYASGDHIQNNGQWLVDKVNLNMDVQFDIIAHSMGGLVARYAIEQLNIDRNVNRLIMIGTPNNGGNMTELAPVLFPKTTQSLIGTFPGVSDLITGSDFFYSIKDFNKKKISTTYYVIAGNIGGDSIVKSDIWVSVVSATYLRIETNPGFERVPTDGNEIVTVKGWKHFRRSSDDPVLNMNYEHSNLHVLSNINGVGSQIKEWLADKEN